MNVKDFINKLDSYFEKENISGVGEFLASARKEAEAEGDRSLLFTVLNEMMGYYRKTGNRASGLEAVESGLKLAEELGIERSPQGATAMINAATALKSFGMPEKAVSYYEKAALIYDAYLPQDDGRIAGLCNNYALALTDTGRYEEAEKKYMKAVEILENCGDRDEDIANTYVNMAHLYGVLEKYEKIEECLEKALYVLDSISERNSYYAFTCRKCAPSFGYFGYFEAEKELNKRAGEIYERN